MANQKLTYEVTFTKTITPVASFSVSQGSLLWTSSNHTVRSPIVALFQVEDHDDSESDDDLDLSDMIFTAKSSWLEKIHKTVRSILQAVNLFQTPVDKSEAARVRKEYEESNAKLSIRVCPCSQSLI